MKAQRIIIFIAGAVIASAAIFSKQRFDAMVRAQAEMRQIESSAVAHAELAACIKELVKALHEEPLNRAKIEEILQREKILIDRNAKKTP